MGVRALSSPSVDRAVGAVWDILVDVRDSAGELVDDAPVVTVTLPDTTTQAPAVETVCVGVYRAEVVVAASGTYRASAVTSTHGAVDFAAHVTAAGLPGLDDIDAYLGDHSFTDEQLQDALDAEAAAQRGVCRVPAVLPSDLRQALLRRVQRNLAMRPQPFAMLVDGDGVQSVIPGNDPEVRRLERRHRRLVMG